MSESYKPRKVEIPFSWEEIDRGDRDYEPDHSCRTKVIGGWIVYTKITEYLGDAGSLSTSMVFIPDPNHEWEL